MAKQRANRTIIETARSILQASKLPLSLWAEAVNFAAYVRNRVSKNKREDSVRTLSRALTRPIASDEIWAAATHFEALEGKLQV